ncbi:hypothetical protein ACFYWX_06030 [Streptomyces sp. NPDC002888]|uniref:hypothetical protein n=1 Tax=Streptomyces sp. NPDC002888 TaxID=3364668 RepID=UPI003696BBC4
MPVNQHSDPNSSPFEDQLSAALHEAGGAFDADRGALAAAGQVRGRRLRLRRRAAVAGGAAGLALVGVGGALLLPGGGSSDPSTAGGNVAAPPKAKASATPTRGPVSGDELVQMLEKLLPKGTFSNPQARGTHEDAPLPPYAQVVFDDGKGAAAVSVGLNQVQPGGTQARQLADCPDKLLAGYDSCDVTRLKDGSVVKVVKGYEYPDRRVDTKLWAADLVTPTGQHVSVSEWNSAAEKGAGISRDEPPLSPAQLKEVASAEVWRGVVDAIPVDPRKPSAEPTPTAAEASGRAVSETLVGLLPKGLTLVERSHDEGGYAYVVVEDGKGQSFVQINVQPDMRDVADQLYGAGSETLPDGTKVKERQGPGEKAGSGVVMWTVDTLRTDGMRVVISAFNARTQNTDATRPAPALSMKQLREIALSPKWQNL